MTPHADPTTATKVAFVLKTLEAARVSMTDFSRLTNISRTTLYAWKRGSNVTDMLRLSVAFNYAVRLDKAVQAKRLPLAGTYSIEERVRALRSVIAETNREMRG